MTENNPIQVLMDEHEIISSVEARIKELNNSWLDNAENYKKNVLTLLAFFKEYSDKFHHHKEEEVLFKELRNNPDFILNDIVEELEGHHDMFRDSTKEIEEAIKNDKYEKVQELLTGYINDLLDHIAVENDELFIMAESLFNEDELERMYFLFQDIDMELGQVRKQELVDSIKQMASE